ncbi:MAG: hypothetical protein DIZ80_00755 [endosymbiont of Galathealinum brachiosum]|uniref:Inner membrane protein YgaP-like transmembrane domain-containing protein n=1 Tax=endosymbiont of Galathealinum brachiosum TaxID=2200906 RepID=A0A370DMH7_9GAMM|nr:MAG: hypothetical protein DIZ80_00755 [endosymbiont of Galathealinum brachiosum]
MSERQFRFIMGVGLWAILIYSAYFETMIPLFVFVGTLLFEGVTNLRIPGVLSRLRYGKSTPVQEDSACNVKWFNKIESERVLRFIVSTFVLVPFYVMPDMIWFIPWFVASMLILAGITNICPMVMFMKWAGLK